MRKFKVKMKFVFEGEVEVSAENKIEAEKAVAEDFHFVMGGSPHTFNDEAIVNWDFDMHPEKVIKKVKLLDKVKTI